MVNACNLAQLEPIIMELTVFHACLRAQLAKQQQQDAQVALKDNIFIIMLAQLNAQLQL